MNKKESKLKIRWNEKEESIEVFWENTQKANANYLLMVFDDEFEEEMKSRGFDIKTIKFEIRGLENE